MLYHRHFNDDMDDQLFGGILSAINMFSEQFIKEGLSSFELSSKLFTLKKQHDIIFLVNSAPDVSKERLNKELDVIVQKFFEIYPKDVLTNWNGEVSMFRDFEDKIQNSLQGIVKKFKKAFW